MKIIGVLLTLSLMLAATQIANGQDSAPAEKQFLYKLTLTRACGAWRWVPSLSGLGAVLVA
ncbi:MAG TPA: hypothetical protein VKA07_01920 [Candidatus Sulfotelmatobacter sp.]|nr:hypothetical protein [Candidatus Sulfotelmatobacter sp.]